MGAAERTSRTVEADELCQKAYALAGVPTAGAALVAVGGYGRGELAPYSDLDVVLVVGDHIELGSWAGDIWYPLWDSGTRLDHSVRTLSEMLEAASADLRVALGFLDARHVAGDSHLTLRLRTTLLTAWRRDAKRRLPQLRELTRARHERAGELAHSSVPDVKEAEGGLRDATTLRALVATWLVDVPHVPLEQARRSLLDTRDELHAATGRRTDRIGPELWDDLAVRSGLADAEAAQRHVRETGRRIAHLSRLTWRRVDAVLARPQASAPRRPDLIPVAPGIALAAAEIVLGPRARPDRDPLLLLRAAAEAAERNAALSPVTAARLVAEGAPLPEPWPRAARDLMVRLLASGAGLLGTWETLEETGALAAILPEWERIRLRPHASAVHRFTVDRHVVETCVEAAALIRRVARPDVLMVAALLHDIGKGAAGEHSAAGEPIARLVATRMGFDAASADLVALLVRWHLLLARAATTRDPEDPATVAEVVSRVGTLEGLELLAALTEADARATSPQAWTLWRASLVTGLADRVRVALGEPGPLPLPTNGAHGAGPAPVRGRTATRAAVQIEVTDAGVGEGDGYVVTVTAPDRVGLLADVAAVLALQRVSVRRARAWEQDGLGCSRWEVAGDRPDPSVLRQRLGAHGEGRLGAARLDRPAVAGLPPTVVVSPGASESATVIEVRAADRPGVLYLVLRALAGLDVSVRSAHAETLGPQAVDVFYVQEPGALALSESRAAAAVHAIRVALDP